MNPEKVAKKRKLDQPAVVQLQCQFYITKKSRFCPLGRKKDTLFCPQHSSQNNDRVPCPLDPKHTVESKKLKEHLVKCNSRPKEIPDSWFELDRNIELRQSVDTEKSEKDTSSAAVTVPNGSSDEITGDLHSKSDENGETDEETAIIRKYIAKLNTLTFPPLKTKLSQHKGLQQRLSEVSNQKHPKQQASLIGNMSEAGLLGPNTFYLEFGCGKAELSRFINLCVLEELQENEVLGESYGFGLIDRGVNRMKNDPRIRQDCNSHNESFKPIIKRTRIDIKDINVDKFIEDVRPSKVVGVSKHLCGAATDLTLKLVTNSTLLEESSLFGGMMIAMCCRHVCDYKQLLPQSKQFLAERGFDTEESFTQLKRFVSWAVCGTRPETKEGEECDSNHISGLNYEQRETLGFLARRLIDESRVYALRSLWRDYDIDMFLYAEKETTLENVCLCVTRKGK